MGKGRKSNFEVKDTMGTGLNDISRIPLLWNAFMGSTSEKMDTLPRYLGITFFLIPKAKGVFKIYTDKKLSDYVMDPFIFDNPHFLSITGRPEGRANCLVFYPVKGGEESYLFSVESIEDRLKLVENEELHKPQKEEEKKDKNTRSDKRKHKANLNMLTEELLSVGMDNSASKTISHKLVSKKKRRYIKDGFDLDLAYICDRIIAMGYPAQKTEAMYRNPMPEVQRFFATKHPGHFMIYNLCSERKYDPSFFQGKVEQFPFPDHNCPDFDKLPAFLERLDDFLCQDEKNVCALHCKAGKGRTGLIICCYLLHTNLWTNADEALNYYAFARTFNQQGVTIPSQRRYVKYYAKLCELRDKGLPLPRAKKYRLKQFLVSKSAPAFNFYKIFCKTTGLEINSKDYKLKFDKDKNGNTVVKIPDGICVEKDVLIKFGNQNMLGNVTPQWRFWFHTAFIPEDEKLSFNKLDLDKANKVKKLKDFNCTLELEEVKEKTKRGEFDLVFQLNISQHELEELYQALRMILKSKRRMWKGYIYEACFVARDAIDWLVQSKVVHVPSEAIQALEALRWGGYLHVVVFGEEGEVKTKELNEQTYTPIQHTGAQFLRFNQEVEKVNKPDFVLKKERAEYNKLLLEIEQQKTEESKDPEEKKDPVESETQQSVAGQSEPVKVEPKEKAPDVTVADKPKPVQPEKPEEESIEIGEPSGTVLQAVPVAVEVQNLDNQPIKLRAMSLLPAAQPASQNK